MINIARASYRGFHRRFSNIPVTDGEFAKLMDQFHIAADAKIGVAVSGGVDSMALLRLAVDWHRNRPSSPLFVLTVDHTIRPEAAQEVQWVTAQCEDIQLTTSVPVVHIPLKLAWEDGIPSYSKLQLQARCARYDILAEACAMNSIDHLLVAHNLNDQIETFLLRLARASGIAGLVSIQPQTICSSGISILRPLLGITKRRLIASCKSRFTQSWQEDPSNNNLVFDRVRARSVVNTIPVEMLEDLNMTIGHMKRWKINANRLSKRIIDEACTWVHPLSACWININRIRREHIAVTRMVLADIFKAVSGEQQLNARSLGAFVEYIYTDTEVAFGFRSMFGCRIRRFAESIIVMPDYDRQSHQALYFQGDFSRFERGSAAYSIRGDVALPLNARCQPLADVWRTVRHQVNRRSVFERLPNGLPSYIKDANFVAIVSATNRVLSIPALPAISLDVQYQSKSTVDQILNKSHSAVASYPPTFRFFFVSPSLLSTNRWC